MACTELQHKIQLFLQITEAFEDKLNCYYFKLYFYGWKVLCHARNVLYNATNVIYSTRKTGREMF